MFKEKDFVKVSVCYYDKDNRLLGASKIPNNSFTIPMNCYFVSLIEYTDVLSNFIILNNFYIGKKATIKELLKKELIINISYDIPESDLAKVVLDNTLLIYEVINDKSIIKHVLKNNEKVFPNIKELKVYLDSLSKNLEDFYKQTETIKRRIYSIN